MPSIKQQVLVAVGAALDVSAVTLLATGGVWNGQANETANYPFLVFNWQGFNEVQHTFKFGQSFEGGLLLVKSYSDENSDANKAPTDLNDEILEACETILHAGISLSGNELTYFRKFSDVPDTHELLSDRTVFGTGRLYKVEAQ